MSADWLGQLDHWHWWTLGILFVVLEIFSPAAFFLWLGISAGLVGVILWLVPALGWQWQLLWFSLFSLSSVVSARAYLRRHPIETEQPGLNRRADRYLGRVFNLEQAIVNGQGRVRVDDSSWKVSGPDAVVGTRVRVVAVDGTVLRVEPADTLASKAE